MTPELPLAAAQRRLGKPGRPRTRPVPAPAVVPSASPSKGQALTAGPVNMRVRAPGGAGTGPFLTPLAPRLLTEAEAAAYLHLAPRTIRALRDAGSLAPVVIPAGGASVLRVVRYDRLALDRLVDTWSRG